MEQYNLIVMRDLIRDHKETRVRVAIVHKHRINKERETTHFTAMKVAQAAGMAAPPAPAQVNNTSEEVAKATYDELFANQGKFSKAVEEYNKLAKQFDAHKKK